MNATLLRPLVALFLPLVLAACPTAGMHRPAVRTVVSAEPRELRAGDSIRLSLTITNPEERPLTLEFDSGCRVMFIITAPDRRALGSSQHGWYCPATRPQQLVLAPGGSRTWTETRVMRDVDGADPEPGEYAVRGLLWEHYLVRGSQRELKLANSSDTVKVHVAPAR